MDNVKKLLDKIKAENNLHSDYALAKTLGLHSGLICEYYQGKRSPNEYACLQISLKLGIPLNNVIAAVRTDAEKNEKRRKAWENYLKGMGGIAASFALPFLMVVTLIMTPTDAQALPAMKLGYGTICIMLNWFLMRTRISTELDKLKIWLLRLCSSCWLKSGITV